MQKSCCHQIFSFFQVRLLISLVPNPSVRPEPLLLAPHKHQQQQPARPLLEVAKAFLEAVQHLLEVASPWSYPQVLPKARPDLPPRWVFLSMTVITVVMTAMSALVSPPQPPPTPPPSSPPPPQTSTSPSPPSPTLTTPSRRSPHPGQFPPLTCPPPPSPPTTTSPPPPPCCYRQLSAT